jgi:predicted HD superfamily hydrolase involved in NAD metabolism
MLFAANDKANKKANRKANNGTDGVPENLDVDFVKKWVSTKVSERRFKHIEGVAETAKQLATRAGCSVQLAELAGWLHDCCKEVKDKELISLATTFGLQLHPVEQINGHLLHGPVGACVCRKELGLTNSEVLGAIAEHTLGAVNMTTLSKVVFLADCIEPGRNADYTKPIWQALNGESGSHVGTTNASEAENQKIDLDMGILISCEAGLIDLLKSGRLIHPKTVDVRNYYLQVIQARSQAVS